MSTARSRRARRTACELAVNTHSDIKANSHRHARHDKTVLSVPRPSASAV